jgi:SsrA-binding protein
MGGPVGRWWCGLAWCAQLRSDLAALPPPQADSGYGAGVPAAKSSRKGRGTEGWSGAGGKEQPPRIVAHNRRARHDYQVLDTYECGIALQGGEVKSFREGRVQLRDAYARIEGGEVWLVGMHVPPYANAGGFGTHDPDRARKLLLHRRQIDQLMGKVQQQSLTLVPLSVYFRDGRAKVELALARGRPGRTRRHPGGSPGHVPDAEGSPRSRAGEQGVD